MAKAVLDTSVLIRGWQVQRGKSKARLSASLVSTWAEEVVRLYGSDAIVSVTWLEMVGGVTTQQHLPLTEAYLNRFQTIDDGGISKGDWQEALRLARRIPRAAEPRDLGDCLIRVIATRHGYDVITLDQAFPTRGR
jgi:predicted nucleic acid-binding protein